MAGYSNLVGIDPSESCVKACLDKGLMAKQDTLDSFTEHPSCITLSQVLEHIWDVRTALRKIRNRLTENGILYIEVPDATLPFPWLEPFLGINREHVNHFDLPHLAEVIASEGFSVLESGTRTVASHYGEIPSIYVVAQKSARLEPAVKSYIAESFETLSEMSATLTKQIPAGSDLILWGWGEFAQTLVKTDAVRMANVVQIVDRDPSKWGESYESIHVESPDNIHSLAPILVVSTVQSKSIIADATRCFRNPIIEIEVKSR
jgi:hypothetical protein